MSFSGRGTPQGISRSGARRLPLTLSRCGGSCVRLSSHHLTSHQPRLLCGWGRLVTPYRGLAALLVWVPDARPSTPLRRCPAGAPPRRCDSPHPSSPKLCYCGVCGDCHCKQHGRGPPCPAPHGAACGGAPEGRSAAGGGVKPGSDAGDGWGKAACVATGSTRGDWEGGQVECEHVGVESGSGGLHRGVR